MDVPGFAVVTGAASGIGRASARAFIREGCAGIALLDINEEPLNKVKAEIEDMIKESEVNKNDVKVVAHRVDVSQEDQVQQAISEVAQSFGRIDYLVNAAGISIFPDGGLASPSVEDWNRTININLSGSFFVLRATAQMMLKQEPILSSIDNRPLQRGSVINIASIYGVVGCFQATAYTASKHGIVGMTRSVSADFAESGLRINAICPGLVDTPMLNEKPWMHKLTSDVVKTFVSMRRVAQASEIADAVMYLAGGRSSYVTGTTLMVDGGFTSI